MKSLRSPAKCIMKWKLFSALAGVFLARMALATIPLYQNLDVAQYEVDNNTVSPNPPPPIDATAFDNENVFSVSWANYTPSPVLYQTWNTLNYTNTGTMIANSPGVTNGATIFLGLGSFGSGFRFDLHTTNQIPDAMAGSFYNPGAIRCDSIQDGNNLFSLGGGFYLYLVASLGEFKASAADIINPGSIDVGTGGLIQMAGQNVDLSGGTLSVEGVLNSLGNPATVGAFGTVNFNSTGAVGVDTNSDWNPGLDLTPISALSSFVPIAPFYVQLIDSQAYLDVRSPATNYNIYRYVFVQNVTNNANVSYNVYIDPPNTISLGFEPGAAHVEWVGTYTDPASGSAVSDYLYLTDDYAFGASTNVAVINGVPDNFTFITSPTQLLFGPTPINNPFTPLPVGFITNNYAVMFGNLTASTVSTNASVVNPSGNVTNLPGAIKISASNTLNLAFSRISGPNYMSLNCTNQFQGSPGAAIAAPYSDISLGVTNGFLTVSNVLMANLPNWSGNIQAWSTVWDTVDATGVTNEYRVLLVYSALQPTASPWIQNLYLHGTNTLAISDPLYVYGSLYSDAQTVVLQTNQLGVGATSLDGELTWLNPLPFNANSGSGVQQMPNLLWLTNNGAIRVLHNATFGNAAAPQFAVTPALTNTPPSTNYTALVNHGLIADQGTAIWTTYFENDGSISNGTGSFILHSGLGMLTNGNILAGGDVILVATNTPGSGVNGLIISNCMIQAGRNLTLWSTNLTDTGVTNGNVWSVGATSGGGSSDSGFNIPMKPPVGDLLGTTVTNIAPFNKTIYNVWAGHDYGLSTQGYTNNLALGHLVLDSFTTNTFGAKVAYIFNGAGVSNALYVDLLELKDGATTLYSGNTTNHDNLAWLQISTNMMIYYAQAIENGQSVAEAIDRQSQQGANGGRLRWIYSYAGYLSSTNLVYTNLDGSTFTNTVNTALAQSSQIDSDSDGQVNDADPTPFFMTSEVNFTVTTTNVPPLFAKVQWMTIPNATNFIYYKTNLLATNWLAFTNFQNWYYGNNVAVTNAAHGNSFHSPQMYVNNASLPDNAQQTNVWVLDAVTNVPHYYKVVVWPWLNFPE